MKEKKALKKYLKVVSNITSIVLLKEEQDEFLERKIAYVSEKISIMIVDFTKKMRSYNRPINEKDFNDIENIFRETLLDFSGKIPSFTLEDDFVKHCVALVSRLNYKISKR